MRKMKALAALDQAIGQRITAAERDLQAQIEALEKQVTKHQTTLRDFDKQLPALRRECALSGKYLPLDKARRDAEQATQRLDDIEAVQTVLENERDNKFDFLRAELSGLSFEANKLVDRAIAYRTAVMREALPPVLEPLNERLRQSHGAVHAHLRQLKGALERADMFDTELEKLLQGVGAQCGELLLDCQKQPEAA